jgi:hypothetical protein
MYDKARCFVIGKVFVIQKSSDNRAAFKSETVKVLISIAPSTINQWDFLYKQVKAIFEFSNFVRGEYSAKGLCVKPQVLSFIRIGFIVKLGYKFELYLKTKGKYHEEADHELRIGKRDKKRSFDHCDD